jgi:hypothetical protein
MNHIWLTFNLAGNYIGNKNLKPGGDVRKFVRWVEAVQLAYPENPYMRLFCGLGHVILGNHERALGYRARCVGIVEGSESWQHRFKTFGLDRIVKDFPDSPDEVYRALDRIALLCPPANRPL